LPSSSSWVSSAFGSGKFVAIAQSSATAATIDFALTATDFVLPVISPITGTTAYVKAT
jgi:hypothetical protein